MKSLLPPTDRTPLLVCMVLSLVLWLSNALSQSHTNSHLLVHITYTNLPTHKLPAKVLPQQLYLTLECTGIERIRQYWQQSSLNIDYANYQPTQHLTTKALYPLLTALLPNANILTVNPDTIFFRFEDKKAKKVPLQLNESIKVARRFALKQISLQPDSITIIGPRSTIDTLQAWKTEQLVLRDLSQNFEGEVPIAALPAILQADTTTIVCRIEVEEFTEKKLDNIPITITNLPKGVSVFLYPPTVTLQFQVGVSEFNLIDRNNFTVVADFGQTDIEHEKIIPLHIAQQPPHIKNLSIQPQKNAEFIIINK